MNKNLTMQKQIVLMNKDRIERTLDRLSIQVWEKMTSETELIIFGLNERGFATAEYLSARINNYLRTPARLYRFDVYESHAAQTIPDCTDVNVLIIDDVIFSGKTMFSALSAICRANDPLHIEVLTLVDRGHRRYPVLSELTGITIPTKFGEHIEVILEDGILDQVVLFRNQ